MGSLKRLTITELFQKDLVSLRGIAFHDIFNCSGHILVLHSAQKTNKLEQDMRSEGPCQLAGRVDGVSERPVEGGEATQPLTKAANHIFLPPNRSSSNCFLMSISSDSSTSVYRIIKCACHL